MLLRYRIDDRSQKRSDTHVEAVSQPLGDFFADRALTGQDVGDAALRRAVRQVVLPKAVLVYQKAQHLFGWCLRNLEILILVGFHLIGEVVQYIGQRVAFIVTDVVPWDDVKASLRARIGK